MKTQPKYFRTSYLMLAAGLTIGFVSGIYTGHHSGASQSTASNEANKDGARSNLRGNRDPDAVAKPSGLARASKPKSKEFAESVRSIFRETIESRRVEMFEKMLEQVGVDQYASVVSLIRENDLRGSDTGVEWTKLWVNWGRRDPAGAFEFLRTQDWSAWDPAALSEATKQTLVSWSQTDPQQARRFVEEDSGFANGDRSMVYGLIRGWSDVDPHAAADWLAKTGLGMSAEYKAVVESISRKGGREGLDAWFASLDQNGTPAQDKNGFAQIIAEVKREYEPDKAAAWVEQHIGEPWLDESEIVQSTAHAFARRDPQAAMEWAGKTGLENASVVAMATWCSKDIQAASDWVKKNSGNPSYATSASVLVDYLQRSDQETARKWIDSLPDQAMRNKLLGRLQGGENDSSAAPHGE